MDNSEKIAGMFKQNSTDELTQKQIDEFCINFALTQFYAKEEFYSSIIRIMKRKESNAIPTAGVRVLPKEVQFELVWNREFCASRTFDQFRGLMIHECLHLLNDHCTTRKREPHSVWNYAADLAINCFLPEKMYPSEDILVPGRKFSALPKDIKKKMKPEDLAARQALEDMIVSFPKGQAAEWYFGNLMSNEEIKNLIEKSSGHAKLDPKDLQVDANGNLCDKNGNPVSVIPGTSDSHDWDSSQELSDEIKDQMSQSVKDALAKAIREADSKSGGWGSIPFELQKEIRKILHREIPWQDVLKRFASFSRSLDRSTSWTKANKKNPKGAPGVKRLPESRIAIFVDMSGSVRDSDLEIFSSELENLTSHSKFTLYPFDSVVGKPITYKRGSFKSLTRVCGGGTDFNAVTAKANELAKKKEIDGFLVMTDGECAKPKRAYVKRGWVICPNRKLIFEADKKDVVIQMNSVGVSVKNS